MRLHRGGSLNKSRGRRGRLRSTIKPFDSGYSSGFTLFYYFHFIVLICVRVRYLRARSLSLAPPTARRPMARLPLTRCCRARARAPRARAHAPARTARTDIATMLIVSNYSYFVLVRSTSPADARLPPSDNFNVVAYIVILTEIPLWPCFIVGGAFRQSYSISNKPFASEELF